MNKIYRFLLISVALMAFAPIIGAQTPTTINEACKDPKTGAAPVFPNDDGTYTIGSNVGYKKVISKPQSDGTYWIKLEAFATGSASVIESSKPSDVILVLDVSSSMDQNNYRYKGTDMKRWQALRAATLEFVQSIYDNAKQCRSVDNDYDGNRIAIVTYCRTAQVITDGWLDIEEVVSKDESTGTYSGSLINTINRNDTGGVWANYHGSIGTEPDKPSTSGTRPDRGLRLAIDQLLDGSPYRKRDDANLTVLVFTDGYPTDSRGTLTGEPTQDQSKFDLAFANKALYYASEVKKSYGASLYTVGLISKPGRPANANTRINGTGEEAWKWRNYTRVLQLMEWMSSDYPNAAWDFSGVSEADMNYDIDNPFNGTSENNVHTDDDIPAIWRTAWEYHDGGNSGNDYITLDSFVAGDPNPDETAYSTVVSDNQSFDEIFEKISQQSGGTPVKLNSASSTVDIVSSSFKVPTGTNSRGIKLFTARCTNAETDPFTFEREYIKGESPNYSYNEDGTLSTVKVDANLGVNLSGNVIEVTGFEYSNNWCGTVKNSSGAVIGSRGYKVIILIPVNMNPDAVGGPNVETNAPGSGIYENYDPTDPNNKPLVEFDPPTVSLPVNVYIEKVGLEGRESAKFRIDVAYLPASGDPEDVDEENWEYVSTVFVTNSPNSEHRGQNPMVRVKGMPATKMVDGVQKPLIYRITEEGWSWSYTPDETTYEHVQYTVTSKVDNPFTFENDKRTSENIDVKVRHAESKSTNIFTGTGVVKYDDSKENTGRKSSGPAGLTTGGSN